MNDFSELKNYCFRLYKGFIKQHVVAKTLLPTQDEEDSVKAFCLLSHAAIEEYFEKMTFKTIESSYKKYKTKKFINTLPSNQKELDEINDNISQLIKTLVLSSAYTIYSKSALDPLKEHKSKLELAAKLHKDGNALTNENIIELTKKTDIYTNEILKETIGFFRSYIESNHGASLKYLLKLLIPVGLDIPEDLLLLNSLQKLATYRGEYAHTKANLTVILSASDSIGYITDALKLCYMINENVKKFHAYSS